MMSSERSAARLWQINVNAIATTNIDSYALREIYKLVEVLFRL
jgi:hypothetical protein